MTVLEHDRGYMESTLRLLEQHGLAAAVEVRLAPIPPPGKGVQWYDTALDGPFDFVFMDGPPLKIGRDAGLFALHPQLSKDGWEMWLHDGNREHEQACVARWEEAFPVTSALEPLDERGVIVLRPRRVEKTIPS